MSEHRTYVTTATDLRRAYVILGARARGDSPETFGAVLAEAAEDVDASTSIKRLLFAVSSASIGAQSDLAAFAEFCTKAALTYAEVEAQEGN